MTAGSHRPDFAAASCRDAPAGADPITLEVLRNALYSIADEMIGGLIRASYSTNIKDRRDAEDLTNVVSVFGDEQTRGTGDRRETPERIQAQMAP